MTFVESISTCFAKYADFNGRAQRPEFWWWVLFVFLVNVITGMISPLVSTVFSLATLLPCLAVTARRLHDINRSGWWQLIGLIPVIGLLVMIYWCVQEGEEPNQY